MSSAVLLSNFPLEYTEDRLTELARSVGPLLKLKLAFDENTGRSKCLCVVQYLDVETASSAVRNLNNYTLENGRQMKCVYVDDNEIQKLFPQDYIQNGDDNVNNNEDVLGKMLSGMDKEVQLLKQIPPLPRGIAVPNPDLDTLNTVVYNSLMSLDQSRLHGLLKEANQLSTDFPDMTRVLLKKNPQLLTALIQGALLLNVIKPEDVKGLMVENDDANNDIPKSNSEAANELDNSSSTEQKQSPVAVLEGLPLEQQQMVKTILEMSKDDILKIPDPQQQQLYLEIQNRFLS